MDWKIVTPSENELISHKKAGTIYCGNFSGGKYISAVSINSHTPIEQDDIALINISPRVELRIAYIESHNRIEGFRIKKIKQNQQTKEWITDGEIKLSNFTTSDLAGLCEILSKLSFRDITQSRVDIDELDVGDEAKLESKLRSVFATPAGRRILTAISQTQSVSDEDITNLAFRKEQLEVFKSLLENSEYFSKKKSEWSCKRDEDVWQYFFEKNTWVYGYGLRLISCEPLDDSKLQQIVASSTKLQPGGKIVDALLKTRGCINSLLFCEIKKHDTSLLEPDPYRPPDGYVISSEVSGACAQIQKTIHKVTSRLAADHLEIFKPDGTPTREIVSITQPKGIVVVGSLKEFEGENGINNEKFTTFELFRRNTSNPEIITFDELYERASFIVQSAS